MSDQVSLCVLRLEVTDTQPQDGEPSMAAASGQRRPGQISVETYPSRLETATADEWALLPMNRSTRPVPVATATVVAEREQEGDEIGFFSGNPFVELTKGVLHLYKEDARCSGEQARTLCLLGVPASVSCHELLAFTAPCHADMAHMRVLRDSTPNQYMALLTFRSHGAAREFHGTYDGAPFHSLEPESVCRAVWVSRVEWAEDGRPPAGHTELPTCPVCLERMDESVDGVLTILCNHAFHAGCLVKWGDATCPVCRCVQSPELAEGSECMRCGRAPPATAAAADALWICLICGHVGCGRYQGGHAASHYRDSGHCYALQLGSNRVWDYKGDNFVHRLLQNKADGKLVPSGGPAAPTEPDDKLDAAQLEFTYLLTSQLDAQRQYFEDRLARREAALALDVDQLRQANAQLRQEAAELTAALAAAGRERQAAERRATHLAQRTATLHAELTEERQLGEALRANQQQWQAQVAQLEQRCARLQADGERDVADLRDQLRDLMFFIEAQQVIQKSSDREDIAGGTVTLAESSAQPQAAPAAAAKARLRGRRRR